MIRSFYTTYYEVVVLRVKAANPVAITIVFSVCGFLVVVVVVLPSPSARCGARKENEVDDKGLHGLIRFVSQFSFWILQ